MGFKVIRRHDKQDSKSKNKSWVSRNHLPGSGVGMYGRWWRGPAARDSSVRGRGPGDGQRAVSSSVGHRQPDSEDVCLPF